MALLFEMVVNRSVDGDKFLQTAHASKAIQLNIPPLTCCTSKTNGTLTRLFYHIKSISPQGDEASRPRPAEKSGMTQIVTGYLRIVLTVALVVGMMLASNSRMVSHYITELSKIVTDHHAEIADHGHAHEDIVDVLDAYHGHAHDVADHDHNLAFLRPRTASGIVLLTRTNWALASSAMPDRGSFDLDRPPRA
jgi:hypothetical protein